MKKKTNTDALFEKQGCSDTLILNAHSWYEKLIFKNDQNAQLTINWVKPRHKNVIFEISAYLRWKIVIIK